MFAEFNRHFTAFPESVMLYWESDAYQFILWLLGLAALFNECHQIPKIATWFARSTHGGDDPLLVDLFTLLGIKEWQRNPNLVFEKPYHILWDVVRGNPVNPEKNNRPENIEKYLRNWYKGMKNNYWYDRHKGRFASHFGYWALETGLMTLLFDLDDSSYRDLTFYPKDLVDYARTKNVVAHLRQLATPPIQPKAEGGDICTQSGVWFAPTLSNKEIVMKLGDKFPIERSSVGIVSWYFKRAN